MLPLGVEAANRIARRTRLVILAELTVNSAARVLIPAKRLEEESTAVPEQIRFDNCHAGQVGWHEVHDRLGILLKDAKEVLPIVALSHRICDPDHVLLSDISHAPGDLLEARDL